MEDAEFNSSTFPLLKKEVVMKERVWFEDECVYFETYDGLFVAIDYLLPKIEECSDEQHNYYELGTFGIHWEEIDKDVSFESFEYDMPKPVDIFHIFPIHPILNALAAARKLGNLLKYIRALKKPSAEHEQMILEVIQEISSELCGIVCN